MQVFKGINEARLLEEKNSLTLSVIRDKKLTIFTSILSLFTCSSRNYQWVILRTNILFPLWYSSFPVSLNMTEFVDCILKWNKKGMLTPGQTCATEVCTTPWDSGSTLPNHCWRDLKLITNSKNIGELNLNCPFLRIKPGTAHANLTESNSYKLLDPDPLSNTILSKIKLKH